MDPMEKLQRAVDELEIRNLIARVYLMADEEPDLEVYGANFTEDAIWERVDGGGRGSHLDTRLVGRDLILADRQRMRDSGRFGPGRTGRHLITTLAVTVSDDDTAQADSKFLIVDGAKPRPVIDAVGHYRDTLCRTEDGWKLSHRRYASMSANH
ncbi:nuclear transport factor 2 family protein [Rhodococcus sp. NPDC003322]